MSRPVRYLRFRLAVVLSAALLLAAACAPQSHRPQQGSGHESGGAAASPAASPVPVRATVDGVFAKRPQFGVYLPDQSTAAVDQITTAVGCRPTLFMLFASLSAGISANTIQTVPGVPVLSLEPWRTGAGPNQPDYSLQATIDGRWDEQYKQIAKAILDYRDVVLIRFAHEMNGNWYPWGIANGNKPGQYPEAWRHVVNLFRAAGVVNALWIWSPNVARGANTRTISQFWPGPEYVDLVGLTGYGVHESSPAQTYSGTLSLIKALTDKPIVLTETGAKRDSSKQQWISNFGPWLHATPQVAGFVWNQGQRDGDWRFNDTGANAEAFKRTLSTGHVAC
jgi:hypothetical protein